jgi:FtsZ-interacting cell division protein ZipA
MSSTQMLVLLVVVAVIVIVAVGLLAKRKRRSRMLRERFGPEYDRVVKKEGDVQKGERVLDFRQKHREKLHIRPLSPDDRESFAGQWRDAQAQFVDDPKGAVTLADGLVIDAMQARGYPITDFEQQAADLSVDHPVVVENYRAAHEIALRHGRGQASTEDLRKAMVHYRALFEDLLGETGEAVQPKRREA